MAVGCFTRKSISICFSVDARVWSISYRSKSKVMITSSLLRHNDCMYLTIIPLELHLFVPSLIQ